MPEWLSYVEDLVERAASQNSNVSNLHEIRAVDTSGFWTP